jgi:hypothetical protein
MPEVMGVCHCRQCQKQSGSAFATMASVPKHAFRLVRGRPKIYGHGRTASGDVADIAFCGRCGSPLHTTLASQPEMLYLRTGALEDTGWFRPQFHVWCAEKQDWVVIEGAESLPRGLRSTQAVAGEPR